MFPLSDQTKEIHVSLEGGKAEVDRITKQRDELRQILRDLAEKELEEKRNEVKLLVPSSEWEEIDGMGGFELDGYVSALDLTKKRKISKGSVRLQQSPYTDILQREWEDPNEMFEYVYRVASDPSDPNYEAMRKVKRELRSKLKPKDFTTVGEIKYVTNPLEREAIRELGKSFTHQQYTEFIQRKAREDNARR